MCGDWCEVGGYTWGEGSFSFEGCSRLSREWRRCEVEGGEYIELAEGMRALGLWWGLG